MTINYGTAMPARDGVRAAPVHPRWRTTIVDVLGFVLVVWSIPLAIVVVGAPLVLGARLVIELADRIF